ncbi:MAG TPA: RNA 2',3'-cyclic phosphodiesterase [Longimicrobium sp.]|nr:RNA 2',3'-cyclic phosphodiesterase [Longimicrobium sp.]
MNDASAGRLFLGLPLPPSLRDDLEAHLRRAFGGGVPGRPVPPANWHLTLRFLGQTSAEQHRRLVDPLRGADLGPAFELAFGGLGAFPRPARATVLWVGVSEGADAVKALAARMEAAARAAGFAPEPKPFSPHLTVSRLRDPADLRGAIAEAPPFDGRMRMEEVVLFRSHLGGGAPRYEAVERFGLGSA